MTPERQLALESQVTNLDRKLDAIHRSLKEDVTEIKTQTRLTNGRVTEAERQLIAINAREEEREKHAAEMEKLQATRDGRRWSLIQPTLTGVAVSAVVMGVTYLLTGGPTP